MKAFQLFKQDGTPQSLWGCGECGVIYGERDAGVSERCCVCAGCGKSTYKKGQGRSTVCKECWTPYHAELARGRLDHAKEIIGYTGPIYDGDRYYETMDDYLDRMDGEAMLEIEFVHPCHIRHFTIDIEEVMQNILENASIEDDDRDLSDFDGHKELRAAVAAFNAANASTVYWDGDESRKIRVPAATPAGTSSTEKAEAGDV